ncbi:prepilin-type N-terminal cleavage/methylation domain-containing protein [Candidatus Gracilibacteria bacterium]|nr:prepilin-type N-terminal cleavage/methylation domain-containing protein [Candidatus Gracilibacteria bacterium]
MKKENLAFTLIELLVVVSIIAIITGTGVFYGFKQLVTIELSTKTQKVIDIIDNLDRQVDGKEIIDYSLEIDVTKNIYGYSYTVNTLGLEYIQNFNFDSTLGSGTLSTTQVGGTGSFAIRSYAGVKYIGEEIIQGGGNITSNYNDSEDYKITSTLSGQILNDIFVSYYDEDNIKTDEDNKLELLGLKSEDGNTNYSSISIENKNGKKSITGNNGDDLASFSVVFEKQGAQHTIIITK